MVKGYVRGKYTIIFIVFKVLVAIIYRGINRRIMLRMIIIDATVVVVLCVQIVSLIIIV